MKEFIWADLVEWINSPFLHIGQTPVTVGSIVTALVIILAAYVCSVLLQRLLLRRLTSRLKLSTGVAYAFTRFVHYAIIVTGVVLAVQCIGLNFGSLAMVFGFLSVGIGFGLQNVTSNFISGLILLVEQPIGVGDFISIDEDIGKVAQINMRSTVIRTLDNVSIIIPNSRLVENNVINWSHMDPQVRIHCPVGVAYGSDVEQVRSVLLDAVKDLDGVLDKPAPEVRFINFGDSALEFELLVWTDNPERQFFLHSRVHFAVNEAFREAGIRIPFPQRDIHVQMTPAIATLSAAPGPS